jgi:hypothetical protein
MKAGRKGARAKAAVHGESCATAAASLSLAIGH